MYVVVDIYYILYIYYMYYLLEKLNIHKLNFTILNHLSKSVKKKLLCLF